MNKRLNNRLNKLGLTNIKYNTINRLPLLIIVLNDHRNNNNEHDKNY